MWLIKAMINQAYHIAGDIEPEVEYFDRALAAADGGIEKLTVVRYWFVEALMAGHALAENIRLSAA